MNKATRIALVTGEMRDCMSPAGRRRGQTTRQLHGGSERGRIPRPRRRQEPGGQRRLAPSRWRCAGGCLPQRPRCGAPAGAVAPRRAGRGGAHGHLGAAGRPAMGTAAPAAASSPPCGGGGAPGARKLRRGGGPWETGVKRPDALQVSDESHPRGRGKLRVGRGGYRCSRPQGDRAVAEGATGSAGSPAAADWDRAGWRVPPSRGFPSLRRRSPPPPSSSATASCAPARPPPPPRGSPAARVRAVIVTAGWWEGQGFPFLAHPPPPAHGVSPVLTAHWKPTGCWGRR